MTEIRVQIYLAAIPKIFRAITVCAVPKELSQKAQGRRRQMPKRKTNEKPLPALKAKFEDALQAFLAVKPPKKGKKKAPKKKRVDV